jgi:hypothetical protein
MKLLSVLTAGTALLVWQAQAVPIALTNPSFELPGTGKISTGWNTVPGWFGGPALDSGVEFPGNAGQIDGLMASYSDNGDANNSIWASQTTGYTINPGDDIFVSLIARYGYTASTNYSWAVAGATLHFQLWSANLGGPGVGAIYDGYFDLGIDKGGDPNNWSGGDWVYHQVKVNAADLAGNIGETLGISIFNSSGLGMDPYQGTLAGIGNSWVGFDNVMLDTVPEPGTIALLTLGGLGALVAIRRRRA